MTVLITGAAGHIGATLMERLPALGWQVRGFDRVPLRHGEGIVADLDDGAALAAACAGAEAVVHLAGCPTEAPWPVIRAANIDGTHAVFEAARAAGVPRLVYASSNHAVGFERERPGLAAAVRPRPDTLYGVSKAFGEALGRFYADRYGMRVACLRIGSFGERPPDHRALATWLSPGDCTRLVDACLRAEALGYLVLWGVSANTRRQWADDGAAVVGYRPEDDAEAFAADFTGVEPEPWEAYVGGVYTTPDYGIDAIARPGDDG